MGVPVFVTDNLVPPLSRTLKWEAFSVFAAMKELPTLKALLQGMIADGTYQKLYANALKARSALVYDLASAGVASGVLPLIVFELSGLQESKGDASKSMQHVDQHSAIASAYAAAIASGIPTIFAKADGNSQAAARALLAQLPRAV